MPRGCSRLRGVERRTAPSRIPLRAGSRAPLAEAMTALRELDRAASGPALTRVRGDSASARAPPARCFRRAERALAGGVASSFQRAGPVADLPRPRRGPRVWDVDGNEYFDFHNGFSSMVQGHAHPAIGAAVARPPTGAAPTSRAPTEDAVAVAEEFGAALRARALALHQLGHGVDDGRDPDRPRRDRA